MTRYLSVEEVLIINSEIHHGEAQLRDRALLESAVARPMASAFGEDAYSTILEKAAALLHSLAHNHPFIDGNKRTATLAMVMFLEKNHYRVTWEKEEALIFILNVARGKLSVAEIAEWLQRNTEEVKDEMP